MYKGVSYPIRLLGLYYYNKKRFSEAEITFIRALVYDSNSAYLNFKVGMACFKQEEWHKAEAYFRKAIEIDPSRENWNEQLHQVVRHLGKSAPSTEEVLRSMIAKYPDNADLYDRLAKILSEKGKTWQEIDQLKAARVFKPLSSGLSFRLGKAYDSMGNYIEASKSYDTAIKLKSNRIDPTWYYRLGLSLEKRGAAVHSDTVKAYRNAIKCDKNLKASKFGVGVFSESEGDWKEAIKQYEKFAQKNEVLLADPDFNYKLGMAYDRVFDWETAELYYSRALLYRFDESYWHYRLGFVQERQNKYQQAAEAYECAANLNPANSSYSLYRQGYVLSLSEDYEAATKAYLKTRNPILNPFNNLISKMFLQYDENSSDDELGKVEEKISSIKGYHNRIIESVSGLLKTDSSSAELWFKLGEAYEGQNSWDKAVFAYQQAVTRSNIHKPAWYYQLGHAYTKILDYKSASQALGNTRILKKPYGVIEGSYSKNNNFKLAADYIVYFEELDIDSKSVLFESFNGKEMSCNPYAIFLSMLESQRYRNWKFIWVINDLSKVDIKFKSLINVFFVKKNSDAYLRFLVSCKYLINNSTFPTYFIRKERQLYLNTWHGTPWKSMGIDIKNNFMEHKNTQRNFLHASHLLSPNKHTTWVLTDRYDISETYTGAILEAGYPRIDLTVNLTNEKAQSLKEILGILDDRKIVLLAPTWRGILGNPDLSFMDKLIGEIKALEECNVHVIYRGHYYLDNDEYDNCLSKYIVPESINTNELLGIVDVLITDYSSIAFDFMATGRPIVYYIDDYDIYREQRGLYFEVESLPGRVAHDVDSLVKQLEQSLSDRKSHPNYLSCIGRFTPFDDGTVTERVTRWFIDGVDDQYERKMSLRKKSLLICTGEFNPNGITTSLVNLVSNIDQKQFAVTILIDPDAVNSDLARLSQFNKLPRGVKVISRAGRMNRSIEEAWVENKFNQFGELQSESMWSERERMYAREYARIVGYGKFDVLIEFAGYSNFWSGILGCAAVKLSTVKVVYQHNDLFQEWRTKFHKLKGVFKQYRYFDKVISVSEPTMQLNMENLSSRFNIPHEKFEFCDNIQNPPYILAKSQEELTTEDELLFATERVIFITIGRLSPEKDQQKLIKAVSELKQEGHDVLLLVLGTGPLLGYLQKQVEHLALESNVFFLGHRENPFPLLLRSDCLVLSSNHEGQPMVLLEAMILSKPVIATDIIGSRSALNGRPGQLVENSVEGLVDGMVKFLKGDLEFGVFDYEEYQKDALEMFYSKVCN